MVRIPEKIEKMTYNLTQEQFETNLKNHSATLLFKKIPTDVITPVLASIKLFDRFPNNHFLLESTENGNNKGRFSAIGLIPDIAWKCSSKESFINRNFSANSQNFVPETGQPLENLRNFINSSQIKNFDEITENFALPAIASGVFGFMGYDMVRLMEKIPDNHLVDEFNIPDSIFIRPQITLIFDNFFDHLFICAPVFSDSNEQSYEVTKNKIELIETTLLEHTNNTTKKTANINFNFSSNYSEEEYIAAVETAKNYIKDGDIFQVLPSQRFTSNFPKDLNPLTFYRALRSTNPSPFLFYYKFDDFVLTGSSPEIMVSLHNKKVTVRPLAGTRKRGNNATEDKAIAADLLSDEKEIAEHLMLIDLARHDVGRVSEKGSVVVSKKMEVENYSHVMHISSTVDGVLQQGKDALDTLISGFPAGTVSGAPKIRAMEIIEEIEKVKRSFYAGCAGYFSSNGDMESCITLRSSLIKDEKIYLQAGAGVVFDSDPKSEYQECLNKARALMRACERIEEFN